jgi:hypothetical protein
MPYARGASDFLFVAARKDEAKAGFGVFHSEEALLNANLRYLATRNRAFLMQAEAGLALNFNGLFLVASGGSYNGVSESREHYVQLRRGNWTFRAGKFPVTYGINFLDHTVFVKEDLGHGQGTERYQAEIAYTSGWGGVTFGGRDLGANLKLEYLIFENWSIGLSGEYERPPLQNGMQLFRYGLFSSGGTKDGTYYLFEADHSIERRSLPSFVLTQKVLGHLTIGHFIYDGVDLHVSRDISYDGKKQKDRFTGGLRLMLRPHVTISADAGVMKFDNKNFVPVSVLLAQFWL